MGNFTSCFNSNLKPAKLINLTGNLQRIKVPITAAEIMLVQPPGHLVSPVPENLRSSFRLSALRADEVLSNGGLYFLIPVDRLNSFVTESELEMLRSGCRKGKLEKRRRKSKVLPVEMNSGGENGDGTGDGEGFTGGRVGGSPMCKPVLEPIYE